MGKVRLTFLGAAETVTGSKYLIETDSKKILIDCGLFQGKKELRLRNWEEPKFDPASIDAMILTHAHIDHTGYIPLVVKRGFRGPIYCTAATLELTKMLLLDSAHLQEEEARYAAEHHTSKHNPPKPLYTQLDAREAEKLYQVIPRDAKTKIGEGIYVEARCAGHILGSTHLSLEIEGRKISFSGDIGRYGAAILRDPAPADFGDLLLCESTYGDRFHPESDLKTELEGVIRRSVDRGGPIIIPAFAVGRTQSLLYILGELERENRIRTLPVYVDSPMAIDATEMYGRYEDDLDVHAAKLIEAKIKPLRTRTTRFCRSVNESKELNKLNGPRIIISASGMATGGRVLHHLRHHLGDARTTILFVGYQAEGTRGAIIQSRAPSVKIFGEEVPVKAAVETVSGLSAHGDQGELLKWLKSGSGNPGLVRIVHGEPDVSAVFGKVLQEQMKWPSARPARHLEVVEL